MPGRFPRREALQPDASQHDRPGRPAVPQGPGNGGEALLHRPWADGEPLWSDCRCSADRRSGHAERLAALDMIESAPLARARSRWAPTRATMRPISSRNCARSTCARMSPATPMAGARRSTGARRVIPATPRASASASASRRHSAGSRRSPAGAAPGSEAWPRWDGSFAFAATAYNLIRLPKLLEATA